ncbi:hypothetical protein ACRRS0_02950 [Agarivorans sp. QJM3NY_29]|uniref:hypothetical protein n=1 Tax=unclassified Agarivorans TaxID=2636026 RepID=UPI003D7CF29A
MKIVKILVLCIFGWFFLAAKPNLTGFRPEQVCQAGIASMASVAPKQVSIYRSQAPLWQLRLSKHGQTQSYYCQLQADEILWRRAEDSLWQDSPKLRFQSNSSSRQLIITHYLGQARLAEHNFRGEDFL